MLTNSRRVAVVFTGLSCFAIACRTTSGPAGLWPVRGRSQDSCSGIEIVESPGTPAW